MPAPDLSFDGTRSYLIDYLSAIRNPKKAKTFMGSDHVPVAEALNDIIHLTPRGIDCIRFRMEADARGVTIAKEDAIFYNKALLIGGVVALIILIVWAIFHFKPDIAWPLG